MTAISVLFALFRTRPSPFCLLDEVDAPLDEANIRRFVRILDDFTGDTQFLIISHSKVTMAEGETLYGVTMEEEGVSKKVVVKIDEVDTSGEEAELRSSDSQSADKNVLFADKPVPEKDRIADLVDADEAFPATSARVDLEASAVPDEEGDSGSDRDPEAEQRVDGEESDRQEETTEETTEATDEVASIADLPTIELPNRLPAEVVEGAEDES